MGERKKRIAITAVCIFVSVCLFGTGMKVGAATEAVPGSSSDPLVSLSYLQQEVSENSVYKKVSVAKGSTITLSEGGELIVYSGTFTVVGNSGIVNLTTGSLEKTDTTVTKYNLYLAPVATSGIAAKTAGVVYIKGDYTVK